MQPATVYVSVAPAGWPPVFRGEGFGSRPQAGKGGLRPKQGPGRMGVRRGCVRTGAHGLSLSAPALLHLALTAVRFPRTYSMSNQARAQGGLLRPLRVVLAGLVGFQLDGGGGGAECVCSSRPGCTPESCTAVGGGNVGGSAVRGVVSLGLFSPRCVPATLSGGVVIGCVAAGSGSGL